MNEKKDHPKFELEGLEVIKDKEGRSLKRRILLEVTEDMKFEEIFGTKDVTVSGTIPRIIWSAPIGAKLILEFPEEGLDSQVLAAMEEIGTKAGTKNFSWEDIRKVILKNAKETV